MNRHILLALVLLSYLVAVSTRANAQSRLSPDLIPPSPTAASLAKAGDIPVNLYTGTPGITIPLYTIKERALAANIYLQYTGASGIKVQEVAGPASLGWALSAGGVITRTVRGLPDEETGKGYCVNNNTGLNSDTASSTFKNALKSSVDEWDLEPDVFNGSIGGRIIFNAQKVPRFIREQGYVIKKNGLYSADSTWEILDTKGNRYLFGKNPAEREHSMSAVTLSTGNVVDQKFFTSSWYLSEIKSPEGEIIRFTYEKGIPASYLYYSKVKISSNDNYSGISTEINDHGTEMHILDPVYLKSIVTSNSTIAFTYNDRWDITGLKSIEQIIVTDLKGNVSTSFRFNNGYFSDGVGNPYARPKLLGIEQFNSAQNKYVKIAGFHYNETNLLPPRSSPQFDHWGYYNNNPSGQRLKSEGAVKAPDATRCKAGVLTAIDWPTGGQTQFEYELNTYRRNNANQVGGGLRVSKIRKIEGNNVAETAYSYVNTDNTSSGSLQSKFNPDSGYLSTSTSQFIAQENGQIITHSGTTTIEYDLPFFQLLDINGVAVGYSQVVVTYPDQSKEVQLFQDYNSFPDKISGVFLVNKYDFANITSTYSPNKHALFSFYTPEHQQRGLLKEKQLYNSSGTMVQKTVYIYATGVTPSWIPSVGVQKKPYFTYNEMAGVGQTHTQWVVALYHEVTNIPQLVSQETTWYTAGNPAVSTKQFIRNEYKANYPFLLNSQAKSLSNGDSSIVTYKYPVDIMIEEDDIGAFMYIQNIVPPIETVTKYKSAGNEQVTDAVLNLYSGTATKVFPSSIRQLETDQPINNYQSIGYFMNHDSRCKPRLIYDLYAPSGELLQFHQADDIPVAIIWGYHHAFPVAKVVGASYAAAVQYVDTALLNAATVTEAEMRTELSKLRQNLSSAEVTTYTYHPLAGITSETDPSGKTQYYVYDDFSRLKYVKDINGKIMQQQDYYYGSSGGWQDTQVKRCLQNANGQYTGEEEVQQIDKDVNSSTYNQTRWRSLGYTHNCNKPIYVKISAENQGVTYFPDTGIGDGMYVTYADIVVRFYEDAACTVPQYVRTINVNWKMEVSPYGGGPTHYPTEGSGTVPCYGTSYVLKRDVIKEESAPGSTFFLHTYDYSLVSAYEYNIVQ